MTQVPEQVRRLARDHGSDLAFVVNHSGGKDSHECWVSSGRNFQMHRLTR